MTDNSEYRQYDEIEATFQPLETGDLQWNAERFIGERLQLRAAMISDCGKYQGQWVFETTNPAVQMGWIPICDLRDIVVVKRSWLWEENTECAG